MQTYLQNFTFVAVILLSIIATKDLDNLAHNSAQLIWIGLIFKIALENIDTKICAKFQRCR